MASTKYVSLTPTDHCLADEEAARLRQEAQEIGPERVPAFEKVLKTGDEAALKEQLSAPSELKRLHGNAEAAKLLRDHPPEGMRIGKVITSKCTP